MWTQGLVGLRHPGMERRLLLQQVLPPARPLRADLDTIDVGEESNVQDGAVLPADPGFPVRIGARVTIGHNATLHGCHVEGDVLIGMGAVVLDGARVGAGCVLAAGTVVPQTRRIPAGSVVAGPTATIVRSATREDLDAIATAARIYLGLTDLYRTPAEPPALGEPLALGEPGS
ncbi:gamma carbonic anhydrase family protein [Streptomyces ipomoeae]|uniref:Transferase hexapeptide repeat protein n=2 Tax=Streptomyces ipomoeae TaxID=103232 RepID=L1KZU9_9ACTN|nr:gamma carbonic anhydrase family protein [Streptomyces ipomoeae]EKX66079.1 transferase hexapeptide repeat protein [Streptomyces ipomoeae 91-03]MDX2696448.1 gamma carbonic anhydrase family protein [Streptomyces ipomoeae]MDX2842220.1 gamma carbonic anhydrase family protein [Streptomyces ipomoeae]